MESISSTPPRRSSPPRRATQAQRIRPGTTTPTSTPSRRMMPRRKVNVRPPPPSPPGPHAAVYLTVTDFAADDASLPRETRALRALMRDCSIVIQRDPPIKEFSSFYLHCHAHQPADQLKLYHIKDLPYPGVEEPGLLAMNFVAWIPRQRLSQLEALIRNLPLRTRNIRNSSSWVHLCLHEMVDAYLISFSQMVSAIHQQDKALSMSFRGDYPNYHE